MFRDKVIYDDVKYVYPDLSYSHSCSMVEPFLEGESKTRGLYDTLVIKSDDKSRWKKFYEPN